MSYGAFLEAKAQLGTFDGFAPTYMPDFLFDFQQALVEWAVLTPFMGVGSEVYQAVEMGRRGIGVELKPSYYRQAQRNIAAAGVAAPGEQGAFAA